MTEANGESLKELFHKIEGKWQDYWENNKCFQALSPSDADGKPKFYCLDMFPYPSGDGLHVGHPLGYVATDILSRFKRMQGFNVLHPMGWDAFGLPAEQYAIEKGVHPAETTAKNIETFKRQLRSLGLSFDWSREINTSDPRYYKWTQWIFKKLFEKGLAYQAEFMVNWCPALGTVLANDEVEDGKSERGGYPVERRPMRQWVLKITEYADRLLEDLEDLDWPESTKELQRNWIGRSEGAKITFPLAHDSSKTLEVFTTRPDTLFGVSFMVVAPEHDLVKDLVSPDRAQEVSLYVQEASRKSDLQRTDLAKSKTGVFTGSYVSHPLTGDEIPVWVADYVLVNYGTGAIMGVPAHDERDKEFAEEYELPIVEVIDEEKQCLVNCHENFEDLNGLPLKVAMEKVIQALEERESGHRAVSYKMRDWIFARQRYWGEPIPVLRVQDGDEAGKINVLDDSELPLELPQVQSYKPTGNGDSPLAAISDWVEVRDFESGALGRRETNTMPGSAGSSWYFLRFMDPQNDEEAWSRDAERYWGPVDFYMGGPEHAVGHLLYARFWNKFFYDLGLVSHKEPFKRLVHQGMILGSDGEKMSKSRGNVVNPDDIIREYGADSLRLFEMFLGPIDKAKPWQTANIEGVYRFLSRVWRLFCGERSIEDIPEDKWPKEFRQQYHKTIKEVAEDTEALHFNTAISSMMVLINEAYSKFPVNAAIPKSFALNFTKILSPYAPHLSEHLWQVLGQKPSVTAESWPDFDPSLTVSDEVEVAVQVNGKLRDRVQVTRDISEEEIKKLAYSREQIKKWVEGKEPKKVIYVPGRILNIVL